jgi:hypothetical protein
LRNHQPPNLLRPGPLLVCLALATALLAVRANVAQASLFLVFHRTSGRPGTVVHVRTAGNGACALCPHRMSLYFVAAAISDSIRSPDDPGLVQVGTLTVDDHANGSGFLTVPEVRNGPYVVMTYCEPCAPHSGGRLILPVGPFPRSGSSAARLLCRRRFGRGSWQGCSVSLSPPPSPGWSQDRDAGTEGDGEPDQFPTILQPWRAPKI